MSYIAVAVVGILMMCIFFYDVSSGKVMHRTPTQQIILISILVIGFLLTDVALILLMGQP